MESENEQFTIAEIPGLEESNVEVLQIYDPIRSASTFAISVDSKEVGILELSVNDTWEWIKGDLPQDVADAIGSKIDARYS